MSRELMPDPRAETPALREALKMTTLRPGKPTEADRPKPSVFPMTPAARAALELKRAGNLCGE